MDVCNDGGSAVVLVADLRAASRQISGLRSSGSGGLGSSMRISGGRTVWSLATLDDPPLPRFSAASGVAIDAPFSLMPHC
ncbi:hypothetical protein C1A38_22755 [Verrucosispora sp. ts21]|nr:hypothetical protein C1A38_22755 [Verrucosispora sp. ts21]